MNGHGTLKIRFDDKNLTIAQLSTSLIRQVLLTNNFASLHVSDAPHITPTFDEYTRFDSGTVEDTVKRAFRDHLLHHGPQELLKPIIDLLLTLHTQLRNLVPNRNDLHTLVNDDTVRNVTTVKNVLPLVMHASTALRALESHARAETTQAWQEQAQRILANHDDVVCNNEFMVNSILYLLFKTELCQADKQDFYLQNLWAPRIHVEGPAYLRTVLNEQFRDYTLTKAWLKEVLRTYSGPPSNRQTKPQALIRQAWVETILFRKDSATALPEIFSLDVPNIEFLRLGCQRAVAACALALHAGIMTRIEPTSDVWQRREDFVRAMAHHRSRTYEMDVSDAIVAMAKASSPRWNDEGSLRNRTVAVLRGQDPVLTLFDSRMKEVFVDVIVKDGPTAPTLLRSGVGSSNTTIKRPSTTTEIMTEFERVAEASFCKKGLTFYASELAILCGLARKIVDLVWIVHQDLIEQTFRESTSNE